MTPATVMAAIPDDVLRVGDTLNQRQRQSIRLARYFEQRGHRPTWAEIEAERARRTTTNQRTHRRVIRRSTTPNRSTTS
ncbi:MAG: hypothetical protein ACYDDW_05270 [Dermatophilaceae bacterium]